jgi:hypothetical protein
MKLPAQQLKLIAQLLEPGELLRLAARVLIFKRKRLSAGRTRLAGRRGRAGFA